MDRSAGRAELSPGRAAQTDQGSGYADRADLPADAGRPAPFPQEPRRGLLPGTTARAKKLRAERAADAHQQGRRPVPSNPAGSRREAHSGTVWSRSRPAPLGPEAGRARREERQETGHHRHGPQAGGLAASSVGERRSLRTIAQQQEPGSAGSRVNQNLQGKEKTKLTRRVPVTALKPWPNLHS